MRLLKDQKIISALSCPHCGAGLTLCENGSGSLICDGERKHCFDLSAIGHVNFAAASKQGGGDNKLAVSARSAFLDGGHYSAIAEAVVETLEKYKSPCGGIVVDAGCGEGYYTEKIADRGFSAVGFDLSKPAVEAGAKRVKRSGIDNALFAVASVFELPILEGSAAAVVNIFAPCAEAEYMRVLGDDGILIAVYAGEDHLMGLKRIIYDRAYLNEVHRADLPVGMEEIDRRRVSFEVRCRENDDVMSLFAMTPYYYRTSREDAEKLRDVRELVTEADVMISVYRKVKE